MENDQHSEHPDLLLLCDGECFRRMMEAGAVWLEQHVEHINSLNVYPVPDGDTGINMHLTMQAALREMSTTDKPSVGTLSKALAHGSLMGARGNSGVILSQVFRGMAKVLGEKENFTALELAAALQEGSATAYKGVIKPVEGTILTVARESAEAASAAASEEKGIIRVLETTVCQARESVAHTPMLLSVLADAGVVDAGGQGLLTILEGALRGLKGETLAAGVVEVGGAFVQAMAGEEYGFEAMFVVRGENLDVLEIRKTIASMGDSVLVVGDSRNVKVHVHTDKPGAAIEYGARVGTLSDITVENLQAQVEEFASARAIVADSPQSIASGIAIVAVVSGDGFQGVFESLGVGVTVAGGQTMNPSTQDLMRAVDALPVHDVILLPNNSNIIMAAQQARKLSARNVVVVPTKTIPQGISALLAFNYQVGLDANAVLMTRAAAEVQTIEITTAVRDATMDGLEVAEGEFMGLLNGTLVVSGKSLDEVVDGSLQHLGLDEYEIITLYHGTDVSPSDGQALAERVQSMYPDHELEILDGGQPHYHYIISVE
ncbi:MAG: DAK2 domain-containing protein [Anaerolineae bacterium]|nr:DAK2 domain-containing protein [Anaerolineae bacterium]